MRVLVTGTTFPRWKNDTEPAFVYWLAQELKSFDQLLLVPSAPKALDFEEMDGVAVKRFRYFPKNYQKLCYDGGILPNMKKSFLAKFQPPFLYVSEKRAVKREVEKGDVGLIHAHWIIPQGMIAYHMKKKFGIPYIATAHAGDVFHIHKGIYKKLGFSRYARKVMKNAAFVTANSSFTKKVILDICPDLDSSKVKIIPMGVDLSNFHSGKHSAKLKRQLGIEGEFILTVGRLAEKKGIAYLIEAMPRVLKELPQAKLVIVGDGPLKQNLQELVSTLNLNDHIVFVKKISHQELPSYYATADIFVGPSIVTPSGDTEGLGVVFLEALASGTAIIGSNVGGIPDIIKDGETGLLVKEKDSQDLSEKIIYLLKHNQKRADLIKAGNQHIKKNFDWKSVGEKFSALYTEAMQS